MPLIPALGRQRQAVVCEFQASLVYRARQPWLHKEILSQKTKKTTATKKEFNQFLFYI